MDTITSLAATAVAVLAPYLAKAGEEFAKEVGKAAASKIGELHKALETRFKKGSATKKALTDLEADPSDKQVQEALEHQLTKQMSTDKALVDTLKRLLYEIMQDRENSSFLTQVYDDGNVGEIFNIHILYGGLILDKRSGKG